MTSQPDKTSEGQGSFFSEAEIEKIEDIKDGMRRANKPLTPDEMDWLRKKSQETGRAMLDYLKAKEKAE